MATILKAGNATTGLSLTPDSAGTLEFKTGTGSGTTAMTIDASGNVSGVLKSGTAVASTSGTSIDFSSIPSTAKRITVMFQGVSTNATGAASIIIQAGVSGTAVTSGYTGINSVLGASTVVTGTSSTAGFVMCSMPATAAVWNGMMVLTNITGNTWVSSSSCGRTDSVTNTIQNGFNALAGTLNLIRITTTNGTDAFDAGTVNILWE